MSKLIIKNDLNTELSIEHLDGNGAMSLGSKDFKYIRDTIKGMSDITPNDGDVVMVKGYHTVNDGGGGLFVYSSNEPKSNHNGGTVIDSSKAFPDDWTNKDELIAWFNSSNTTNGCWKRIFDRGVNVKWFGAIGDGSTDNIFPIKNAILSSNIVIIDKGDFYLSETLNIKKPVTLTGIQGSLSGKYDSKLIFKENIVGIFIHRYNTDADETGNPFFVTNPSVSDCAEGTVISNLYITSNTTTYNTNTKHGIWMKTLATVENCVIDNFDGNGIHLVADTHSTDDIVAYGNANHFNLRYLRMQNCYNGLYTNGGDANAGSITQVDCSSNRNCGIYDSSFLGNTYVACHTANNVANAYLADNANARNVFLGCYSESGQLGSQGTSTTIFVGGMHGAGFTAGNASPVFIDAQNFVKTKRIVNGDESYVNLNVDDDTIMYMQRKDIDSQPWRLKWLDDGSLRLNFWNYYTAFDVLGINTAMTAGRSSTVPYHMFIKNLLLGDGSDSGTRKLTYGDAAPTSGDWAKGDIVYNTAPDAGGKVGWVCTEAGTPGTWKAFGVIDS